MPCAFVYSIGERCSKHDAQSRLRSSTGGIEHDLFRRAKICAALRKFLAPLVSQQRIRIWDDRAIEAGEEWREEITRALGSASVARWPCMS